MPVVEFPQIVKSLDYEIVRNDEYMEARLYVPRKRTIEVSGRLYFLQFPQTLAVKVILEREPTNYYSLVPTPGHYAENFYRSRSCSFLNFAFVIDGLVYPSYIYQVDYVVDKLGVCLVNDKYHAYWPSNANLTEMMRIFWTTSFSYEGRLPNFNSYHHWQTLNLNEVLEKISESPSETLDAHLLKLEEACKRVSNVISEVKKKEELKKAAEELKNAQEKLRKTKVNELLSRAWAQRKKLERPFVDNFNGERDF